jgi:hypothetical protein
MNDTHTPDTDRAAALAAGLRALAAMVTEHPHLAKDLGCAGRHMLVSVGHGSDVARDQILAFARAGLASGATVTEMDNGTHAGVRVAFGPICVQVYAVVEQVHDVTRIVEYTPRSILAELGGTTSNTMGAVA